MVASRIVIYNHLQSCCVLLVSNCNQFCSYQALLDLVEHIQRSLMTKCVASKRWFLSREETAPYYWNS
jgi:hypothetical protein